MIEQFTLECIQGKRRGRTFTFPGCGTVEVGRRRDCDVPVPDAAVSAHHCVLQADGRDLWLRDTGSTNGTTVGDKRVQEVLLRDGDVVTLAQSCAFRVHIQEGVSEETALLIDDIAKTVALGVESVPGAEPGPNCAKKSAPEQEPGPNRAPESAPEPKPSPNRAKKNVPEPKMEPLCRCELCGKPFPERERTEGLNICPNCMENQPEAVLRFLLADVPQKAEDPKGGAPKLEGLRCVRKLGEGAFGAVWLMEQTATGRMLALKTMLESAMAQEVERKKFAREMSIASQLRHPNIVELFESGQKDGQFFMLQEYCPCGSLVQFLERNYLRWGGRLPIELAVDITLQVLDALEYAHGARVEATDVTGQKQVLHGVVHRDIHPGNIFLMDQSDHPVVKVGDWGLSKAYELAGLSGVSAQNVPTGTMDFAPMQQHLNFRYSGPEVDVWAAAAVLCFLLTGQPPRGRRTAADPFPAVRDVRRLRPEVPEKLAHALNRTLREKPRLQVLTAAELRELLTE